MSTYTQKIVFALLFALSSAVALSAGNGDSPTTIFESMMRDGVLDITIETDLTALIQNRRRDEYQPATLTYKTKEGTAMRHDIEVVPRGKFRRRICAFPPVKIKFSKKELLAAGLKKHNNLKLTTHCLDDKNAGNYNVLKEYLAYKLYNELTNKSLRVQLVRVTYVDALGKMSKIKRYGFLIEDDDELAERIGGNICECINPGSDLVSSFDETLMATFEYMIGNEDWSMSMVRNLKMVEPSSGAKIVPVPYDFDFSGIVNASYAAPSSDLGQRHIKDRDYIGFEVDPDTMKRVLDHFKEKKAAMYYVISQFKLLPAEERMVIKDYLDTFYQSLDTLPAGIGKLPAWRFYPSQGLSSPGISGGK